MRLFNKLYGISLFTLLLSVASCTSETEEQHRTSAPDPSGSEARREVMLTLKNKLSVVKTKAGDAIATADENKISSLDISTSSAVRPRMEPTPIRNVSAIAKAVRRCRRAMM